MKTSLVPFLRSKLLAFAPVFLFALSSSPALRADPTSASDYLSNSPGANASITDAVSGTSMGILTLQQSAYGGYGAYPGGNAGSATSILTDANNPGGGSLVIDNTAVAGSGGISMTLPGTAGNAIVNTNASRVRKPVEAQT